MKRIIICCDGTWQSSVTSEENIPSNVTKLCRLIARTDDRDPTGLPIQQIVYYDSGVGTGALSDLEKSRQGATGDGLAHNVIEAYNFIVLNYEQGDQIFCFGFSRGAYTARAVAGLVTDIGVCEPRQMQIFPEVYKAYMKNHTGKPFPETDEWKNFVSGKMTSKGKKDLSKVRGKWNPSPEDEAIAYEIAPHGELAISDSRQVKVVGVWDTVGSLGIPDGRYLDNADKRVEYGFHNVKLSKNIEHAFQALALDERRKAFHPTLWYIDEKLAVDPNKPELKQVWFPGMHINIGGGSDDGIKELEGDLESMANVTFCWMLECISPYLAINETGFQQHLIMYRKWLERCRLACTRKHEGTVEAWTNWALSYVRTPGVPPPHPHEKIDRGWGTGPHPDSLQGKMYNYAGGVPQTPGECQAEIYNVKTNEYELKPILDYGITNEYIHPVAAYRLDLNRKDVDHAPLHPKNGTGFKRTLRDGRYWWIKGDNDVELPEWVIHQDGFANRPNFERMGMGNTQLSEEDEQKGELQAADWLRQKVDAKIDQELLQRQHPLAYP